MKSSSFWDFIEEQFETLRLIALNSAYSGTKNNKNTSQECPR